VFWAILALGYLVLFSLFDHGYFGAHSGEISEAHLGRYATQALPAVAALAGMGAWYFAQTIGTRLRGGNSYEVSVIASVSLVILSLGYVQSIALRRDRIAFEHQYRLGPAKAVLELVEPDAAIVTGEPSVLSLVSEGSAFVVDMASLGTTVPVQLVANAINERPLYVFDRGECEGSTAMRYREQCRNTREMVGSVDLVSVVGLDGIRLLRSTR